MQAGNAARTLATLALLAISCASSHAQNYFTSWPKGTSPQEVGERVAQHFVTSPHQYTHA